MKWEGNIKNSILYIFDETAGMETFKTPDNSVIHLCPVTTDQNFIKGVVRKLQAGRSAEIHVIDFVGYFHEKAFSVRDGYIRFISDFSEQAISSKKNIKEYFRYPLEEFSTWWLSLINEKNTVKTAAFHNFVKLLCAIDFRERYSCNEIWSDIKSRELTCAIKDNNSCVFRDFRRYGGAYGYFYYFFSLIKTANKLKQIFKKYVLVKKHIRASRGKAKKLGNIDVLALTYFPSVEENGINNKKFINRYYGVLQEYIEKNHEGSHVWLAMSGPTGDYSVKQGIELGKKIDNWGYPLYFYEEFLCIRDFIFAGLAWLYIAFKYLIKIKIIKNKFKFGDYGIKLWRIFEKEWHSSFMGSTLLEGILVYKIFDKLTGKMKKNSAIIYLCEMHAWEKALNVAARKNGIRTMAIQHASVPLLLLNYFNYAGDMGSGDYIHKIPRPDFIACTGRITAKLFQDSGWKEEDIVILGPIRFQYLQQELLYLDSNAQGRDRTVIVALPIMKDEAMELLYYVFNAFRKKSDYNVMIKCHPDLKIEKLLGQMNLKPDELTVKITNSRMSELLPKAKALVVTCSASALESIACGCPVIIPKLSNIADMNPLSGISDIAIYTDSPDDLRHKVDNIVLNDRQVLDYRKCSEFIKNYFDFSILNNETEFTERMKKVLVGI